MNHSTLLPEPYVEVAPILPWHVICRFAVRALVTGHTLDELLDEALRDHLARGKS
jgi:hypothetical protein